MAGDIGIAAALLLDITGIHLGQDFFTGVGEVIALLQANAPPLPRFWPKTNNILLLYTRQESWNTFRSAVIQIRFDPIGRTI